MASTVDSILRTRIGELSIPGIMIGHRVISPGDERALAPEEAVAFATSVPAVRRASGAGRIVARQLLAEFGLTGCVLPKGKSGAPVWPEGIVGSISHDARIAVAAIASRSDFNALGIDIEPAEALPAELLDMVATEEEREEVGGDLHKARLLFVAKEAVYKAVYPLDETFLDHHEVKVSLARRTALVPSGRIVDLRLGTSSHLLALAFIRMSGESF